MRTIRTFPLVAVLVACGADGQPGSDAPWNVDLELVQAEEVVSLRGPDGTGGAGDPADAEGADELGFGRVAGAALDAAGRIHVLDAQAQEVFVFDAGGTYLHSLGGAGEGPGELSRPSWLSVVGEEVLVRDSRGISTFRAGGEWIGRRDPANTRSIRAWRVGERGFVEAAIYGSGSEGIDPRETFLLADSDGVVDTLAVGHPGALYFRTPQMSTALPTPFCDLVHVAVGPVGRVFLADGERGTLSRYVWGETLEFDGSWEVAPPGEPVAEERVAELLERVPAQFRDPDEEFVAPPVDSRLCGVQVEGEERVWVRLTGTPAGGTATDGEAADSEQLPGDPSEEGELWRAIAVGDGEPLLDVRFPPGVRISGFGSDLSGGTRAVGVHADDLGVQSVRVYRLR